MKRKWFALVRGFDNDVWMPLTLEDGITMRLFNSKEFAEDFAKRSTHGRAYGYEVYIL